MSGVLNLLYCSWHLGSATLVVDTLIVFLVTFKKGVLSPLFTGQHSAFFARQATITIHLDPEFISPHPGIAPERSPSQHTSSYSAHSRALSFDFTLR